MSSVINSIIPPQSFEIVRDRIGRIIYEEMANQFALTSNQDFNVQNWIERFLPFDKTELPSINVMLAEGQYSGQTQIQSDGTYRYYIDVYVHAKTDANDAGDSKATFKLHRLLGLCRAIIEDPRYKTLGFTTPPGFIMNRHYESLNIREPIQKEHDALSSVMGRLTLSVKVPELPGGFVPTVQVRTTKTTVKLSSTEKGYLWIYQPIEDPYYFDYSFDYSFD